MVWGTVRDCFDQLGSSISRIYEPDCHFLSFGTYKSLIFEGFIC